ncbi:MAG: hypothetical protein EOM68_06665 [Spirochaetia bacterium]|nr:hypothetical protein [Spirochaetia bacterium]
MAFEYMTLAELTKGLGKPDITNVVDEITRTTTMLSDASFTEATGMLEHMGLRKTSLPTNEWVAIDQGGKSSKGHKELFNDNLGMIESWATARQKEGMIAPNPEAAYAEDERDHVTSMALDVESCLIYGGAKPGQFKGIMPRFNKVTEAADLANIRSKPQFITLDNGGETDEAMSSILMVIWGAGATNMLYPRYAANKGIQITKGQWQVIEEGGEKFFQRDTQFLMSTGLSLMNRFAALRIANIDTSDAALATSMPKLKKNLFKAFTLLPQQFKSRVRIYAPGSVLAGLNDYYAGLVQPVTYQGAIPVNAIGDVRFDRFVLRQCDSMLDAGEDVVDGGLAAGEAA